jgi:hypothetical protein
MSMVHVLRSKPDDATEKLIRLVSEDNEATLFALYEQDVDYDKFVDAVFQAEKVFTW